MSDSLDKPARKAYANKGRPLTEKHKKALREGRLRAKIMRELAAQRSRVMPKLGAPLDANGLKVINLATPRRRPMPRPRGTWTRTLEAAEP